MKTILILLLMALSTWGGYIAGRSGRAEAMQAAFEAGLDESNTHRTHPDTVRPLSTI